MVNINQIAPKFSLFIIGLIGLFSCSNDQPTAEQLNGYWTVDSVCQYNGYDPEPFSCDFLSGEGLKGIRGMYLVYSDNDPCPLSIYVTDKGEILRKEVAKIQQDSMIRGNSCNELIYSCGWKLENEEVIAISQQTDPKVELIYYYSRKQGEVATSILNDINNENYPQ